MYTEWRAREEKIHCDSTSFETTTDGGKYWESSRALVLYTPTVPSTSDLVEADPTFLSNK